MFILMFVRLLSPGWSRIWQGFFGKNSVIPPVRILIPQVWSLVSQCHNSPLPIPTILTQHSNFQPNVYPHCPSSPYPSHTSTRDSDRSHLYPKHASTHHSQYDRPFSTHQPRPFPIARFPIIATISHSSCRQSDHSSPTIPTLPSLLDIPHLSPV